jgi:transcriptional regulator with XRE-family HTH domain
MIDFQKALGDRIRALRTEKGWSQDEFANLCQIRPNRMAEIEKGEANVTLSNLLSIASTFKTTVAAIFQDLEDEEPGSAPKAPDAGSPKQPPEKS